MKNQQIFGDSTYLMAQEISENVDTSLLSLSKEQADSPNITSIISQNEYSRFEKQVMRDNQNYDALVPQFYNPYKTKNQSLRKDFSNTYYTEYLQWKEKEQPASKLHRIQNDEGSIEVDWDISESDLLLKKQFDIYDMKALLKERNEQKSYEEMRKKLQKISQEYKEKVSTLIKERQFAHNRSPLKGKDKFSYYRVDYPEFSSIYQRTQKECSKKSQQHKKKSTDVYFTSFVGLIKHPPKYHFQTKAQQESMVDLGTLPIPDLEQSSLSEKKQQIVWKLDVEQILKIPDRQFLVFYNENERKITALTSPSELKIINKKRRQALEKQESLKKLKAKLAGSGDRVLARLPAEKKKQLFELLYENELEEEIDKLSNSL